MRKLASIQRVSAVLPIEGADAIEAAQIEGWVVVIKKGELKQGDLALYLEIDSIVPDRTEFAFLWGGGPCPSKAKARIKTKKLRGQISQGLLLPISMFPELASCQEGEDVSERLGVIKFELEDPAHLGGQAGLFPSTVPKTDETRVQSVLGVLYELQGLPYVITLKCDGSSVTFLMYEDEFQACSRNFMIKDQDDSAFWKTARKYNLPEVMSCHPNLALQAELVGPGIQKNRMGLKDLELRAFNLFDQATGRYLPHAVLQAFCAQNKIPTAPVIELGDSFQHTKESLLKLAEGKYEGTQNEREGLVVRPQEEMYSPRLKGRLSFKVISNRYLLKNDE